MIKDIQVTLYDIFGYLLPGLIALFGLVLLFWALFAPSESLREPALSATAWTAVALLAYVLGHLLQGLANLPELLERFERFKRLQQRLHPSMAEVVLKTEIVQKDVDGTKEWMLISTNGILPVEVIKELRKRTKMSDPNHVYRVCDAALVQRGKVADREIYTYREGFYRALAIALSIVAAGLIAMLIRGGASFRVGNDVRAIETGMIIFVLATIAVAVVVAYRRFRRFSRYRVLDAFLGYLALEKAAAPKA